MEIWQVAAMITEAILIGVGVYFVMAFVLWLSKRWQR